MTETERVTFSIGGGHLNRAAHLRDSAHTLLYPDRAQLLALHGGKIMIDLSHEEPRLDWISPRPEVLRLLSEPPLFLGQSVNVPRFAADYSSLDDSGLASRLSMHGKFVDLRSIAGALTAGEASIAATAKGLLDWHLTHQFCSRCGTRSEMQNGGWRRDCPDCGGKHFPRTDPVVIMLILYGNHVLLGRQSAWPPGLYSLLAGFMEPGETIEHAVRRETKEESGIDVGRVTFVGCQPWPFPSSLMLGCVGEATSRNISIDPEELEDALWVSREEMRLVLDGNHESLASPRKYAIARAILTDWVNGEIRRPRL